MQAPSTTGGTYLVLSNSGWVYKYSSLRKDKLDIQPVGIDPYRVLDLTVSDWLDRTSIEAVSAQIERDHMPDRGESLPELKPAPHRLNQRIPGLVAEDVSEVGLDEFCTYDNEGNLSGVMYDRIPLLLIPIIKEQDDIIKSLVSRIEALEAGGNNGC